MGGGGGLDLDFLGLGLGAKELGIMSPRWSSMADINTPVCCGVLRCVAVCCSEL